MLLMLTPFYILLMLLMHIVKGIHQPGYIHGTTQIPKLAAA
jgi:hypothetical protein